MPTTPILPVHRSERHLAFNSKVEHRTSQTSHHLPLIGRLKESALGSFAHKVWRVCTTTLDGSLSETFKLVSSDDSDARTSASGRSKPIAVEGDGDSFLDAVVVDNDDHSEEKAHLPHQSDSSQRSGHGGSNSTGLANMHRTDFRYMEDHDHYQGGIVSWMRFRGWPQIVDFFEPRIPDQEQEYQTQSWHSTKILAFAGSLYLVLNWVLYLILNNDSTKHTLYAKSVFWGGLSLVTIPTPFMIAFDMPRRHPIAFQTFFCIAVWYCAYTEVIQMHLCGFFTHNHCFRKDFLFMNYYATALPALMMFIVSKRLYNFIAQIGFFVLLMTLIIPVQGIYARNVVSFAIFSLFIQWLHYTVENSQRKMFLLAMQLKLAFRAKHKARLAESKASFTKRRFANYIFHEVRVPLNNAALAFQLLQSGNAFKDEYAMSTEIYALEQGLKMMKTVLNDVLDFEKMDSGHFETIAKPFPLHLSIRAILDQIEVQTTSRDLKLHRELDPQIDAAAAAAGIDTKEPEGLWVVGSELRLHQVLINLASNAVKYTPEGGGRAVRISTEFLGVSQREELPGNPPDIEQEGEDKVVVIGGEKGVGAENGDSKPMLSRTGSGTQTQCLNFRLEVQDSGPGIKPSDLVEDRLFQPFVQTTVGQSSGSGTGLGLAIVKQIVRLSGGRLGVRSRRGEGSKFWIELSYPIASHAEIQAAREVNTLFSSSRGFMERKKSSSGYTQGPRHSSMPGVDANSKPTLQIPDGPSPLPSPPPEPSTPRARGISPRYGGNPEGGTLPPPPRLLSPLSTDVPASDPLVVLVVDDDAVTRVLSSKLLTKLGCVVHTAKDGRECVDMVLRKEPFAFDLICLDNFMPVMTGEEAVKEIRANDREDFIVGCTGNALTEDQDSYREAGADEVMVKPVMIHDFKRLIAAAQQRRLERRREVPRRDDIYDTPSD